MLALVAALLAAGIPVSTAACVDSSPACPGWKNSCSSPGVATTCPCMCGSAPVFTLQVSATLKNTPTTSVSNLPAFFGKEAGMYLGDAPASSINAACAQIQKGVFTFNMAVSTNSPKVGTLTLQITVVATGGCLASKFSPAGVQSFFVVKSGKYAGRKVAVFCGYNANVKVSSCPVYATGADITTLHKAGKAGKHLRLLKQNQNCQSCLDNCVCTNTNIYDNKCFPGDAQVMVSSPSGHVTKQLMRDVKVGDRVLACHPLHGNCGYEDVYFIAHAEQHGQSLYTRLVVEGPPSRVQGPPQLRVLELSPEHLVPVAEAPSAITYKYAREVQPGDAVALVQDYGAPSNKTSTIWGRVAAVSQAVKTGAFQPLTKSGTIVVNGVLASVHACPLTAPLDKWLPAGLSLRQGFFQAALRPLLWLYRMLGARATSMLGDVCVPLLVKMSRAFPFVSTATIMSCTVQDMSQEVQEVLEFRSPGDFNLCTI